jgi:putative endonuclease
MIEKTYYVYIMASRSLTLYIGFTSKLEQRVWQHKNDVFEGSQALSMASTCYFERYATALRAIAREKQLIALVSK